MRFGKVMKTGLAAVGSVAVVKIGLPYVAKGLGYLSGLCDDYAAKREAELREEMAEMGADCGNIFGHDDAAGDDERGMKESIGHDGDANPCVDDARVSDDEEPRDDEADGEADDEADGEEVEDIFDRVRNIVEGMSGPGEVIVVIAK